MRKISFLIAVILTGILTITVVEKGSIRTVTVFCTSDEHGYLEPVQEKTKSCGGAANTMADLRQRGYAPDGDESLLLSGGDMWAGPAVSSRFEGISTVQVMNAMGYDAAAIGNHEFDYGQGRLRTNESASDFPFLSANIIETRTGKPPDYAQPYVIKEVNGVKTAVIGLSGTFIPYIVLPSSVVNLEFTDYEAALRKTVPRARSEGAELIVVVAHVCPEDLRKLAPVASELSIPLLAGGHCHTQENFEQDGVRIIGAGSHLKTFARVDITMDTGTGKVLKTAAELIPVEYSPGTDDIPPDAAINAIVSEWSAKIEKELGGVIGYTETGIEKGWPLFNLLVDSWLWAYPDADIAISNFGGYREAIPPGEIKRSDIVATWPFNNVLIEVELTGRQVADNLECCGGTVAGITYEKSGDRLIVKLKDGSPFDPETTYRVLVNSYIYEGGEKYLFSKQNPDGHAIQTNFRNPVIDWILSRQTSRERPLETFLDGTPRGPSPRLKP